MMRRTNVVLFHHISTHARLVLLVGAAFLMARHAEAVLITNGDFEAGNVGFVSDYIYVAPPASENMIEGRYTVCTNPKDVHSGWKSIGDHTTGAGMMLIANGAKDGVSIVWSQNIFLQAGTTYDFSVWATSVYTSLPANLRFEMDGNLLGTLQLTTVVPDWQQFTKVFTAPPGSNEHTLVIRDLVQYAVGNDFAIDDISLTEHIVPEPSIFLLFCLILGGLVIVRGRR